MTKLRIADDLSLPLSVVTEVVGFLGRRGQGKGSAAQRLAEEMYTAHAQFVAIDPVGIWYGVRLAEDGKSAGLKEVRVFGGLHGDIPLEPTAGKLIADIIVDHGISAVLDVSQFESDAAKARFAADFADRFYFRKKASPSAVHIFLEEAQEFVPQNPQKDEPRMLHAFTRMAKIGRNFGIGMSLISLRPQEVNKKVMNLTEVLFVFQLTGPHERKAVEGWIAEKGIDEDISAELPKLQPRHPHVWSPALLNTSRVVRISDKWTFDASSTPTVGRGAVVRDLPPIDIAALEKEMAATIERAKADDPKELRKRIAELEREAKKVKPAPTVAAPSVSREIRAEWKECMAEMGKTARADRARFERLRRLFGKVAAATADLANELAVELPAIPEMPKEPAVTVQPRRVEMPVRTRDHTLSRPPMARVDGVTGPQKRILNALAWFESLNLPAPAKNVVAWMADASPTSSSFSNNNLGALRTGGLIDYPQSGVVALTDAGRSVADPPHVPLTPEAMQNAVFEKVSGPQRRILECLIREYPREVHKETLANNAEASATSSSYSNNLGALRSLGLIDYPQQGYVVAKPVLFLESR